jgi:hypothetical protein
MTQQQLKSDLNMYCMTGVVSEMPKAQAPRIIKVDRTMSAPKVTAPSVDQSARAARRRRMQRDAAKHASFGERFAAFLQHKWQVLILVIIALGTVALIYGYAAFYQIGYDAGVKYATTYEVSD